MSESPPRVPVSKVVFEQVLDRLKRQPLTPKMQEVKRGKGPTEIIFSTCEGEIPCQVKENGIFIIFEMPSGQNDLCAPMKEFLEQLAPC